VLVLSLAVVATAIPATSHAITFDVDSRASIAMPTTSKCPTLTEPPRSYEAFFTIDDRDLRGSGDENNAPWDYPKKIAQVICGARQNAQIRIAMYYVRAIGTLNKPGLQNTDNSGYNTSTSYGSSPETDTEVIWNALEWVAKNRNVRIGIVLEKPATSYVTNLIEKRLKKLAGFKGFTSPTSGAIQYCRRGCFSIAAPTKDSDTLDHEKFMAISDTIWDDNSTAPRSIGKAKPIVWSSSGNWSRSNMRTYIQDSTLIYNDKKLYEWFDVRYSGMAECSRSGCAKNTKFPTAPAVNFTKSVNLKKSLPKLESKRWVDFLNPHGTDSGRGTFVTFSPQRRSVIDPYIAAMDSVDCTVDNQVRIAMFKITSARAAEVAKSMQSLVSRGCNLQVLLSQTGGAYKIESDVLKKMKTYLTGTSSKKFNSIVKCTSVQLHTKLVMVGPPTNNNGRFITGTTNMDWTGLYSADEHTLTFDVKRASAQYQPDLRRLYGQYMSAWSAINSASQTCK
jgi:hypothetical protein